MALASCDRSEKLRFIAQRAVKTSQDLGEKEAQPTRLDNSHSKIDQIVSLASIHALANFAETNVCQGFAESQAVAAC